jgi:hypothetical protein
MQPSGLAAASEVAIAQVIDVERYNEEITAEEADSATNIMSQALSQLPRNVAVKAEPAGAKLNGAVIPLSDRIDSDCAPSHAPELPAVPAAGLAC